MLTRFLVLGALGQVGSLLVASLRNSGLSVTAVDLAPEAPDPALDYLSADISAPTAELKAALRATDCVCVCLPEILTITAATQIITNMTDGSLWVDTLSVKTGIGKILEAHCERIEALSINPMFAPALGWQSKPVAVVPFGSPRPRANRFQGLLSSWGAQVELVSADQHDRLTATVQAATHAAVLAFGASLLPLGYDVDTALRLATPPHRILLGLLARMLAQNPEVYWDIQAHHPMGSQVRAELIAQLQMLDAAAREPEPHQFDELFRRLNELMKSQKAQVATLSKRLVEAATTR